MSNAASEPVGKDASKMWGDATGRNFGDGVVFLPPGLALMDFSPP